MAEILGLGVTHWPTLCLPNEGLTSVFKRTLTAPNVEARLQGPRPIGRPSSSPNSATMTACRRQIAAASGSATTSARSARSLDDFSPDLVLVWGDDPIRELPRGYRPGLLPARLRPPISKSSRGKPMATATMAASRTVGTNRWNWACGCTAIARRRNSSPPG